MRDAIVGYMFRSGWVYHSVERVRRDLPRWERQLRLWGVSATPSLPSRSWSQAESRAHNLLDLLMRQAAKERDAAIEHQLRNITAVRRFKA